jgi:arginyl-tRNA synthetase
VVDDLLQKGIAREDQGAICVFFEDNPELSKGDSPFIVRKQDGAFLYSTTDIATVLFRRDRFQADRALYVVDRRQALHFKQLFAVMAKLGVSMHLEHVGHGAILGKDGKPLKTRDGKNVTLAALLDEACERAAQRMTEEGLELSAEQVAELSPMVGIGAVKYADLMQNRDTDYKFDWDKMISFKGNAGPYLQYGHARIQAILRKGEIDPTQLDLSQPLTLTEAAEVALTKHLLRFADVVHQAAETTQPHLVCEHLYGLARTLSVFYEQCPVLKAEGEARRTRIALIWLTARQLQRGLGLLGIAAPPRM